MERSLPDDAGGMDGGTLSGDGGPPPDGPSGDARPRDAQVPDALPDAGGGDCCETGVCGPGLHCDFERCGCVPGGATGCCATGFTCPSRDAFCDEFTCECIREDDCRFWGCGIGERCDESTGTCTPDTSCGDTCTGDLVCDGGVCVHRCAFGLVSCPPDTFCSETEGCVPARCTDIECAAFEPPQRCDPARGCSDPCLEPGSDWTWCTDRGGRCYLGACIDDSCSANAFIGCRYRYDCCGNAICLRDDEGEPTCPAPCSGEPYNPPRPDLCRCQPVEMGCIDVWGGGGFPTPWPGPEPFPGEG